MAATIFVVRYRLQHIQPLKYDKIVQPGMAKRHGKSITRELQNDNSQQQELTDTSTNNSLYRNE
ncbi:hypothetical protein, partial [Gemmiger formicilis]|uniref:hypothetical protein n=1 Tax=Gemmiger formicilis TaxID=745368 RepID=UPI003CCB32E4